MPATPPSPGPSPWTLAEITDSGERVTHLQCNDLYYAHLSIYCFAAPFSRGKVVLDAGSGTGYGSAYLADQGALFVCGVDISAEAVAFSRQYFRKPNLEFRAMDLERITGFPPRHFDLIFSSNALEHLPHVMTFVRSAWRLLRPDGILLVAVPPITNADLRGANEANPYHLNIWSPRQWHHALRPYFARVSCYRHNFGEGDEILDFRQGERFDITERDFSFKSASLEQLCEKPTLTAIFVARQPRSENELPAAGAPLTYVDDSYTRPPAPRPVPEPPPVPWWNLPQRAWAIIRERGFRAMLSRARQILRIMVSERLGSERK